MCKKLTEAPALSAAPCLSIWFCPGEELECEHGWPTACTPVLSASDPPSRQEAKTPLTVRHSRGEMLPHLQLPSLPPSSTAAAPGWSPKASFSSCGSRGHLLLLRVPGPPPPLVGPSHALPAHGHLAAPGLRSPCLSTLLTEGKERAWRRSATPGKSLRPLSTKTAPTQPTGLMSKIL